jgi:hypothetical protein
MGENSLGVAIVEGMLNPEVKDLAAELGEFELDSFLDEGLLKEIPLLKTILACRKSWTAISDQVFLKKVASFLVDCPKFTKEEVEAFVIEHWRDPKARRLGDTLVLLLDRLDDLEKPTMLAKVFAAFVRKRINYDAFRRLSAGIDLSFIQDLKALASQGVVLEEFTERYPLGLVRSGFAMFVIEGIQYNGRAGEGGAEITNLGRLFQKCILNDWD